MSEPYVPPADVSAWLAAAAGKWRLQTMQRKSRHSETLGTTKHLPVRVRRFLNGTPVRMVSAVLEALEKTAPYSGSVAGPDAEAAGVSYRPTSTYIRKDGQEAASNGKDATYTIIQDLRQDGIGPDSLAIADESTCSKLSEAAYVWDSPDVDPCDVGEQGVSYQVSNVSRDPDTGLFSYQYRTVTALTQHMPKSCSAAGEGKLEYAESWDNLYGSPGAFRTDAGTTVPVPDPRSSPDGETVRVQVRENPDCTFSVLVATEVAVPYAAKLTTKEDAFSSSVGTFMANQATRNPDEYAPSGGGVVVSATTELNQDGTFGNTTDRTVERTVAGARATLRKTLRGVVSSRTDRGVSDPGLSVSEVGDGVEAELTPGGLWNRTVTSVSKVPVGNIGSECRTTVFEHRHDSVSNVADRPGEEAPPAGGGVSRSLAGRRTEEGTWDVTEGTVREIPVAVAGRTVHKTLRGVTSTVVSRSVADSGTEVHAVGDRVQVEMTPGGLWNRTVTSVSRVPVGDIAESCRKTPAQHEHSVTSNVPDRPYGDVGEAAPNVERTRSSKMTEEGTWDVEERTVTHVPFGPSVVASSSGPWQSSSHEVFQNVASAPSRSFGANADVDVSVSRNQVGTFDGKTVTRSYFPGRFVLGTVSGNLKDTEISGFVNMVDPPSESAGTNQDLSVSAHLNGHGSFDGTVHRDTYRPSEKTLGTVVGNRKSTEITGFWNSESPPARSAGTNQDLSVSAHMNGHGTFDGTVHVDTYYPDEKVIASAAGSVKTTTVRGYWNMESPLQVSGGDGVDVTASAHMNSHGTYDGTTTKVEYGEDEVVASGGWATERFTSVTTSHARNKSPSASIGTASGTPDGTGTATTTVTEYVPKAVSYSTSWTSTVKSPGQTLTYSHSIVVFKNFGSVPTPPGGKAASVQVTVNKFGLCDGQITTSSLTSWTKDRDGPSFVKSVEYEEYALAANGTQYFRKVRQSLYSNGAILTENTTKWTKV